MTKIGFSLLTTCAMVFGMISLEADERSQVEEIELTTEALKKGPGIEEGAEASWLQLTLADENWMTPSEPQRLTGSDKTPQSVGGCYTGCFSVQQSAGICPSGQIAEVQVTGPINACKLGNLRCKSICSGPVVNCNGFAPFCW